MTVAGNSPPRRLGALLAVLGLAQSVGGAILLQQGDSAYFLVVGLGVLAAGVLIGLGKLAGAWAYLGVFALMVGWSLLEEGPNAGKLLPRLLVPAVLCAYILSARVRARLS